MSLLTRIKTTMALTARRPVLGLLDGEYASAYTGRGGDFTDLREYVPGDDLRDLDWKATARRGEPLVRRYVAERKHTVVFAVRAGRDLAAMANPTEVKSDLVITVTGLLGWLAVRHGDYVGLVVGDGSGVSAHRPVLTELGLERLLLDLQRRSHPDSGTVGLAGVLEATVAALRRRSIVIVVTDSAPLTQDDERLLRRLHSQHEVSFVTVGDLNPADPLVAGRTVEVESGRRLPAFLARAELAREVARLDRREADDRGRLLAAAGIPHVVVQARAEVAAAVFGLLQRSRHAR